ncbi:MAG: tetratricopeptide repeat protein [Cyanobacteria bacterium P01_G01_bin.54]
MRQLPRKITLWLAAALAVAIACPAHSKTTTIAPQQTPLLAQTPTTTEPELTPKIIELRQRAFRLENQGDLWGAIATYEQILELAPQDFRAMNVIASLYGQLGQFEQEVVWAERAIATNPEFSYAYINYGNGLVRLGRIEEAQAAFETAAQLAPDDPLGAYSLGVLFENQGDFLSAIEFYTIAVGIDPNFEDGYFNLAAMYANLGEFEAALAALEKVLELNPNAEDAKAMRAAIEAELNRQQQRYTRIIVRPSRTSLKDFVETLRKRALPRRSQW